MPDNQAIRVQTTQPAVELPPPHQLKQAPPCAMVIFGATGDLTKRLVVPALYNLSRTKVLPEKFALIGVARTEDTAEDWSDGLHDALKGFAGKAGTFDAATIDEGAWERLAKNISYIQGDITKP